MPLFYKNTKSKIFRLIFMKKLLCFSFAILMLSCKSDKKTNDTIDVKPDHVIVERFDKEFYGGKAEDLPLLKEKFPYLFPAGVEDSVWTNKLKNPLLQELYSEVQKTYPNTDSLSKAFGDLFAHMHHYFPNTYTPKVITVISEVDKEVKAIYADSLVLVSLDCYLGENHRFYADFPEYQRIEFNKNQMFPDLVTNFSDRIIPFPKDNTLLSSMIYYGKKLYLKDLFLPEYSDDAKIGYSEVHLGWCKANEAEMWSYFIENNLLYQNDRKLEFRFINDAPFSKFYLEIDAESPGRVGQWLGWQIVSSFMENNDVSLPDMLTMDAKTLFERSKYKPAKE